MLELPTSRAMLATARPLVCYLYCMVNKRLIVTDAMDSLDEKLKNFFKKCATTPNLKAEWKDEQMAKIKQVNILSINYIIISLSTFVYIMTELNFMSFKFSAHNGMFWR